MSTRFTNTPVTTIVVLDRAFTMKTCIPERCHKNQIDRGSRIKESKRIEGKGEYFWFSTNILWKWRKKIFLLFFKVFEKMKIRYRYGKYTMDRRYTQVGIQQSRYLKNVWIRTQPPRQRRQKFDRSRNGQVSSHELTTCEWLTVIESWEVKTQCNEVQGV